MKKFLHVGCGPVNPAGIPEIFKDWQEVRFDVDPGVNPDILGDIRDMHPIADASFDAVYSSHNLEHVYDPEVVPVLEEFCRVLTDDGFALVSVPNIQALASFIARGELDETVYQSAAGPINTIDVLFGHRESLARGNYFMAHKTAFTQPRVVRLFHSAGFKAVDARVSGYLDLNIDIVAYK